MKKPQKPNFLEWNNNILMSSIKKIGLNVISIAILDFLFYILSGYLVVFWLQRVQAKMEAFNLPSDIVSLGYEKAQQLVGEVKAFYYLIVFSFVLSLVAVIFLASILKGIIWAKTTNTKITFKLISKFLALNMVWMGFWFALIISISLLIEPSSAVLFMAAAVALGLYFTNTLYTIFMKRQEFKSIINAIKLNISKIHMFLLPYAVLFLLLLIINILSITTKLSQVTFLVLVKMYSLVGIDVSVATSTGVAPLAEVQIILLISMFLNPLTLLLFAFFRYYASSLVNGLIKP
ncbi:hypothetical protein HYX04_03495 [Candidatus Woesearchaeota archaeon]|nr:hypothetical protein [Candidatus Woesearchaeota archaeon]